MTTGRSVGSAAGVRVQRRHLGARSPARRPRRRVGRRSRGRCRSCCRAGRAARVPWRTRAGSVFVGRPRASARGRAGAPGRRRGGARSAGVRGARVSVKPSGLRVSVSLMRQPVVGVVDQPVAVDEHGEQHGRLVERELPPDAGAFTGAERLDTRAGSARPPPPGVKREGSNSSGLSPHTGCRCSIGASTVTACPALSGIRPPSRVSSRAWRLNAAAVGHSRSASLSTCRV